MERPLVWLGLALAAGTFVAAYGLCPGLLLPLFVFVFATTLPLIFSRRPYIVSLSLCFVFFAIGSLLWNARHSGQPGDMLSRYLIENPEEKYILEGIVQRPGLVLDDTTYTTFILKVDRFETSKDGGSIDGKVLVGWSRPDRQVFYSERVRIQGELQLELGNVNPSVRGIEDHYRRHGVHTTMPLWKKNAVNKIHDGDVWHPAYWASRLRALEGRRLSRTIPEKALPFMLTVLLGDRSRLKRDEYQSFIKSGTAHIFAVSGIHTGMVFVVVTQLLKLLTQRRKLRAILTMMAVLLFAMVAGARISVVRASVMIVVYLLAELFDREPDTPTALSFSAIVFLLWEPENLFDTGFLLSFMSIASILIFTERITNLMGEGRPFVVGIMAPTLAVQILPLPLAIHFFHVLPLVAPLTNLVVIPLLGITLCLGFVTAFFSLIYPPLASLFGYATDPAVMMIQKISSLGADTRGGHIVLTSPTPYAMFFYWLSLLLILPLLNNRDWDLFKSRMMDAASTGVGVINRIRLMLLDVVFPVWHVTEIGDDDWYQDGKQQWSVVKFRLLVTASAVAAILAIVCWTPFSQEARVVFLDVGHGDSCFIRTPEGANILIDGGDRSGNNDMGERVVSPFLWSNHVTHLDYVAVSHADMDHIGGVFHVLENFQVGEVLLAWRESERKAEKELLELCEQRNVPVRRLKAGDILPLVGAEMEVLHPPEEWSENSSENDSSLVLRLRWPGVSVLFAGDVEHDAETELSKIMISADVLKVPHHGSDTSSSEEFVQAVAPDFGIISTGGSYGREGFDNSVLRHYSNNSIKLWRTDILGGITMTFDGENIIFKGERVKRNYPYHRLSGFQGKED